MAYVPQPVTLFDGSSAASSTYTSNAVFFGDLAEGSVIYYPSVTTPGAATVQVSGDDGFSSSINSWVKVASFSTAGEVSIASFAGARWLRVLRASSDSLSACRFSGVFRR